MTNEEWVESLRALCKLTDDQVVSEFMAVYWQYHRGVTKDEVGVESGRIVDSAIRRKIIGKRGKV